MALTRPRARLALLLSVCCAALALAPAAAPAATGDISTFAGTGALGFFGDDGPASAARFTGVEGVAVAPDGSVLIADRNNQRVRRVAPDGTISTIAGTGTAGATGDGGLATAAQLNFPQGVAAMADGSVLIADTENNRVRRVALNGTISTIAGTGAAGAAGDGGLATAATLNKPPGVAAASDGSVLIADRFNNRVRSVSPGPGGIITTIAGTTIGFSGDDGPATAAKLDNPTGVAVSPDGSVLIADFGNHRVRKVAPGPGGIITTIAGTAPGFSGDDGPATAAKLWFPLAVAALADGSVLIADYFNHRVRKVAPGPGGTITTIAGTTPGFSGDGGPAIAAQLHTPRGVAVAPDGSVLIADYGNNRVRRIASDFVAPAPAAPAPTETAPSPAPAPTPAPATPLVLAPAPKFSALVTLPSARRCVSRRRFRIRLRQPTGVVIVKATVRVNGKPVKVVRGKRLTAPVDLRGLPKGRFTVEITLQTKAGQTISGKRRYKTCAPKRR